MDRDLSIVAIIPLYNGARYIEEAVRSVLAQRLPPDEFLVVDDGSTDEGAAIVRRLAEAHPQIRLLSKPNGGQSAARNFGVAQSRSALIALLDQDDAWYPGHLAELAKAFRGYDGAQPLGWVYSDLARVDEDGRVMVARLLRAVTSEHPKRSLEACLANDMHVLPSASLIDRGAFEAVGGFDERLSGYEDDDLFLRLFRAGYHNLFVDEPLSLWRNNTQSASYSPRMARSRRIFTDKLIAAFPDDPTTGRFYVRDLIAPRFVKTSLVQYILALDTGNEATIRDARAEISRLIPHLAPARALQFRLYRAAMAASWAAKLGLAAWRFWKPILRRAQAG